MHTMFAEETAFFYGTLVVPAILARVIGPSSLSHLKVQDAILLDHSRHHVRDADYPAVVSKADGARLLGRELDAEESSVKGALVTGLNKEELRLLDIFEGDEYVRTVVDVTLLNPPVPASSSWSPCPVTPLSSLHLASLSNAKANIYIWTAGIERLEPSLWSYTDFVREKLHRWTDGQEEYGEVDRRRAMNGKIEHGVPVVEKHAEGWPKLGRSLRSEFFFDPDYINLNHGSYGSCPRAVMAAFRALQDQVEANPDRFLRSTYMPLLVDIRRRLAELVKCDMNELVIVPNATQGVNEVLRNLVYEEGDELFGFSTSYNACWQTLKYIADRNPEVKLTIIPLTFPCTHVSILEAFEAALKASKRPRIAMIDAIASNPGVRFPWPQMVEICRKYECLSLVDAAHEIGQQPVNLARDNPDFWISNCHKWLLAHRGVAVLQVPKRNQHVIRSSIPTNHTYISSRFPPPAGTQLPDDYFVLNHSWTGTMDWSPALSIGAALDFRAKLGGEERITEYCHNLAVEGGSLLAQILDTDVMDNDAGELTANMVNIRLPLAPADESTMLAQKAYVERRMLESDFFTPVFLHAGKLWIRVSAQVWVGIEDFKVAGGRLLGLVKEVQDGAWKK